jgi:uncharacterized repeat protein (TIGR02543 family)
MLSVKIIPDDVAGNVSNSYRESGDKDHGSEFNCGNVRKPELKTCEHNIIAKTKVELKATEAPGYTFTGWSKECTPDTNNKYVCTVTMDSAKTVTASFKQDECREATTTETNAGITSFKKRGTRENAGSCKETALLSVTVTPNDMGNIVNVKNISLTDPVNLDCKSNCNQDFLKDAAVTLTAKAATGYTFTGWSGTDSAGNNICPDTKNTACNVNMNDAKAVTATFAQNVTYPLSVTVDANGKVTSTPAGIADCTTATCTANFAAKANVTLTAIPNSGYEVNWTGCTPTTKTTCMVNMANAAKTITATFTNIPPPVPTYSVSPESTTNGSSTWGVSYFTLNALVIGNDLRLTVSKTDGTNFTTSGLMYFRVGSYTSTENRCSGGMPVIVDSKFKTCTHDLSLYTNYPKDFYVYFDSDQLDNSGNRTFTWVGPVTVTQQ